MMVKQNKKRNFREHQLKENPSTQFLNPQNCRSNSQSQRRFLSSFLETPFSRSKTESFGLWKKWWVGREEEPSAHSYPKIEKQTNPFQQNRDSESLRDWKKMVSGSNLHHTHFLIAQIAQISNAKRQPPQRKKQNRPRLSQPSNNPLFLKSPSSFSLLKAFEVLSVCGIVIPLKKINSFY